MAMMIKNDWKQFVLFPKIFHHILLYFTWHMTCFVARWCNTNSIALHHYLLSWRVVSRVAMVYLPQRMLSLSKMNSKEQFHWNAFNRFLFFNSVIFSDFDFSDENERRIRIKEQNDLFQQHEVMDSNHIYFDIQYSLLVW